MATDEVRLFDVRTFILEIFFFLKNKLNVAEM